MYVEKKYWKWTAGDTEVFKLGIDISFYLESGLVIKDKNEDLQPIEYKGKNNLPWRVEVVNEKVKGVFFSSRFGIKLRGKELTDWSLIETEEFFNSYLEKTNEDYNGDILYVAFGDSQIKVLGYMRKSFPDQP